MWTERQTIEFEKNLESQTISSNLKFQSYSITVLFHKQQKSNPLYLPWPVQVIYTTLEIIIVPWCQ